jgi:nicotinate-nucleotide adenylyltransferase
LKKNLQRNKTGIFGGTFDPVHNGHLIVAEYILENAGLDRIIFVPSAQPPHKNYELMFSAVQRLKMLEAAVDGNSRFVVSDIELKRTGFSYTIDTIKQIKETSPPDTDIFFIIGLDNLYEIHTWKDPEAIVQNCRLLVADRVCQLKAEVPNWIIERTEFVKTPVIEISSTVIKKRLSEHKNISYFVPEKVAEIIKKETESRDLKSFGGENINTCRHR